MAARPLAGLLVLALAGLVALALHGRKSAAATEPARLRIPSTAASIAINGELTERAWREDAVRTGPFVDAKGARAIPFSEAHLVWRKDTLFLALYAADVDARARPGAPDEAPADAFSVEIVSGGRTYAFDVSPAGSLHAKECAVPARCPEGSDWARGVVVGNDIDGTLDDGSDHDEEWVLEVAIPLGAIGLEGHRGARFDLRISRCDTPPGSARSCAQWPGAAAPSTVMLGSS